MKRQFPEGDASQQLVNASCWNKSQVLCGWKPSLVIGSDQVCVIDGEIIGKPHTREKAIEQSCLVKAAKASLSIQITAWNSEN